MDTDYNSFESLSWTSTNGNKGFYFKDEDNQANVKFVTNHSGFPGGAGTCFPIATLK